MIVASQPCAGFVQKLHPDMHQLTTHQDRLRKWRTRGWSRSLVFESAQCNSNFVLNRIKVRDSVWHSDIYVVHTRDRASDCSFKDHYPVSVNRWSMLHVLGLRCQYSLC